MEKILWTCDYVMKEEVRTIRFTTAKNPYSEVVKLLADKYIRTKKGEIMLDSGGTGEKYLVKLLEQFGVTKIGQPTEL